MDKKSDLLTIIAIVIALLVLFFGDNIYQQINGRSIFGTPPPSTSEFPTLAQRIPAETPIPSNVSRPVPATESLIPLETTQPTDITDVIGAPMVLVPMGEFIMGSNNGLEDEKPVHNVNLHAFYIDKYEVTNFLYKTCVEAGGCSKPKREGSYTRSSYYSDPNFDSYPVIYVDWNMAMTFCKWRGARLPFESEWEKSARGSDGRIYPWGNIINRTNANYLGGDIIAVGSYESGKSIYGSYDMAGNVWEWTASIYKTYPYVAFDGREDSTLMLGARVFRGGSWGDNEFGVRSSDRVGADPLFFGYDIGFRCAKDATP